jgi:hypothetical protein
MLSLEEQLDIAQQIGTTRSQILSNFSDFSLGTSFLWAKDGRCWKQHHDTDGLASGKCIQSCLPLGDSSELQW